MESETDTLADKSHKDQTFQDTLTTIHKILTQENKIELIKYVKEIHNADLAEIIQVEDLALCSFLPLRNLSRMTMPEQRFHAQFGKDFCTEICESEEGKKKVQDAINRYFPMLPSFFGRPNSKNNEIYRKWSIKQRKNEEMLEDYMKQTKDLVEELGLTLPTVTEPKL